MRCGVGDGGRLDPTSTRFAPSQGAWTRPWQRLWCIKSWVTACTVASWTTACFGAPSTPLSPNAFHSSPYEGRHIQSSLTSREENDQPGATPVVEQQLLISNANVVCRCSSSNPGLRRRCNAMLVPIAKSTSGKGALVKLQAFAVQQPHASLCVPIQVCLYSDFISRHCQGLTLLFNWFH